MKRFLTLTIILTAVTGLTLCFAGTERYSSKEVAPAPAPCDWSGFYIGLNVGVAGLNTTVTDLDDWWSSATHTPEDTNFTGGGQIGYNWQKGMFVFGLEADAAYMNTERTQTENANSESGLNPRWRGKIDVQGSVRARAGIAVDNALIYATGGVAISHGKSGFLSEEEGFNAVQDEWQAGFVGGVGAEYAFNCHWTARLEALYFHYPTTNTTISGDNSFHFDIQNEDYVVRVGLNYRFGPGR
jgi:outer membrane immunogenic protein